MDPTEAIMMDNATMRQTDNNQTLTINNTSQLQETISFQYYAWGVAGNIVSAFGIAGNVLSVVVLSNKRMRSSTSIYLIALSIFDTLVLLSLMLFLALPTIHNATGALTAYVELYPYLQPFAYPLALTAQTCSIYTTVGFTVERYIAVCYPLRAAKMCTQSRARKALLIIVLCSIIYNIPRILEYKVTISIDPETNQSTARYVFTDIGQNLVYRHIYFIYMHMFVMLVIPFTVLVVMNSFLIRAVRQSEKAQGKMCNKTRRENNLTVMLISVVFVFLICQIVSIFDNIFSVTMSKQTLDTPAFVKLTCISSLMVITNSAVNFYLYCVFGNKFRRVFCSLFCKWHRGANRRFMDPETTLLRNSVRGDGSMKKPHNTCFRLNKADESTKKNVVASVNCNGKDYPLNVINGRARYSKVHGNSTV